MAAARLRAYRHRMKRAIAGLLLIAACTTAPQWTKQGASPEMAAADLKTCDAQAPVAPRVQGTQGMPSGVGGERKAAFNTMAEREGDRMQKDEKFVAQCMQSKGYSNSR
jgi:hypothetical protein